MMDYEQFCREFEELCGIRLNLYKEKQMKRRILTLIGRKGLGGFDDFLDLLRRSPAELSSFIGYITINVTEFFRTPDQWACFERDALDVLTAGAEEPLKVWSCACATGEEPYSLAVSLLRRADPSRFHILATDLDPEVLDRAREGLYPEQSMARLPDADALRYFLPIGNRRSVSEDVRRCVEFRRLDLLKDPYPQSCDLIVCRNVLIYFTEEAKNSIYARFRDSLKKGGFLFTGNTEQIIYYRQLGFRKLSGYLYRKE